MPPRSPRLPGAGDVVASKYRLERLLKQGGMGAVWIATHLGLDERVALKFMDPRRVSSPEARVRFTREAKAAAQLRSTNIVQILDHGVDNDVPYIAMELLSGEDLGGRLRRAGKLSMSEAASLLEDIARALDRAHSAGIVHRDLKPENIFLAKDGDHEVPKILDFGIAMEIQPDASDDSAATQEGVLLGTPYFMSPEQVRGRANIDHRSDLWSLGVIVFRAITGIRPFGRGAAADVIVQICSDPIPRASVVAPDLPEEVDRFFETALAREPAKRFSSAKEMASAFQEIARIADAAEKTAPGTLGGTAARPFAASRSRKGPPPLPGGTLKGNGPPPGTLGDGASVTGGETARGSGDPTRTSGVLRKGASAPGALLGIAATRHAPAATDTSRESAQRAAEGEEDPARSSRKHAASADPVGGASDTLSMPPPVNLSAPPLPRDLSLSATPPPPQGISVTPPPPHVASASTPPPHDIAEAITAELSAPKDDARSGSEPRSPAAIAGTTKAQTAPGAERTPAGASASEPKRAAGGDADRAPRRDGSRVGIVIAGLAIAGAVVLVGFREQLFGPPMKDPGTGTIVLTAGTVVLVGPGGRAPAGVVPPAPATASAPAPASAAASSSAPAATASATSPATSSTSATASPPATTAPAAATTSAGTAKTTSTATTTPAPPAADTRPKVEPKPADPKPPPTATKPKEDRDLGY